MYHYTIAPMGQPGLGLKFRRVVVRGPNPRQKLREWLADQQLKRNSELRGWYFIQKTSAKRAPYPPPHNFEGDIYLYPEEEQGVGGV